jgi:hypothetical protein
MKGIRSISFFPTTTVRAGMLQHMMKMSMIDVWFMTRTQGAGTSRCSSPSRTTSTLEIQQPNRP